MYKDGVMKGVRGRVGTNVASLWDARFGREWKAGGLMFTGDAALAAGSEEGLHMLEYLAI